MKTDFKTDTANKTYCFLLFWTCYTSAKTEQTINTSKPIYWFYHDPFVDQIPKIQDTELLIFGKNYDF